MWLNYTGSANPGAGSDVPNSPAGFGRFGDGFENGDRVAHIVRRDRVGWTPGNRVGEGFEVGPYRVGRRKTQLLRLGAAPPHEPPVGSPLLG